MSTQEIKTKILKRIIEIDDINTLKQLDIILDTTDKNITKFLDFAFQKSQNNSFEETEDYTNYIKEWVKNM